MFCAFIHVFLFWATGHSTLAWSSRRAWRPSWPTAPVLTTVFVCTACGKSHFIVFFSFEIWIESIWYSTNSAEFAWSHWPDLSFASQNCRDYMMHCFYLMENRTSYIFKSYAKYNNSKCKILFPASRGGSRRFRSASWSSCTTKQDVTCYERTQADGSTRRHTTNWSGLCQSFQDSWKVCVNSSFH